MDGLWATRRGGVGLVVRAIIFRDCQPTWSWSTNFTEGQTDGRRDDMQSQDRALRLYSPKSATTCCRFWRLLSTWTSLSPKTATNAENRYSPKTTTKLLMFISGNKQHFLNRLRMHHEANLAKILHSDLQILVRIRSNCGWNSRYRLYVAESPAILSTHNTTDHLAWMTTTLMK